MRLILLCISIVLGTNVLAQQYCWDNSAYDMAYLTDVSNDHTTYPLGGAFMTTTDIHVTKVDTTADYLSVTSDSLEFTGWIALTVSEANCQTNELRFTLSSYDSLVIDTDSTILYMDGDEYFGPTFYLQRTGDVYTLTGEFDTLRIRGTLQTLSSVCLRECAEAEATCMSYANYDLAYLSDVSSDHATYPIGDTIMSYGYFNFIKVDSFTTFSTAIPNRLCFDDELMLDVGEVPYDCKVLTFDLFPPSGLIIDGDTIYTSAMPPLTYSGTDFEFEHNGSDIHTITGRFEQIHMFGTDFCLESVCIEECHYTPAPCINFSIYDSTYIEELNFDHVKHPAGSTIFEAGDLELFKVNTTSFFDYTTPDSLCVNGDLGIAVSTAPYPCRSVSFQSDIPFEVSVDGEIVFSMTAPPASYTGLNFTFTYDGGSAYQIDGTYDTILIDGMMCFQSICLEQCGFKSSQCLDMSAYDDLYIGTVTTDDVTYPPGAPFITDGNIQLNKSTATASYNTIIGDSISFTEGIIIDVTLAPFLERRLDFRLAIPGTIEIDGVEVESGSITPGTYTGPGWECVVNGGYEFEVSGSFDQILIEGGVNYLDNVCLYEYSTVGSEPDENLETKVYPNPANDFVIIESELLDGTITVSNLMGQILLQTKLENGHDQIDVSDLTSGYYVITLSNPDQTEIQNYTLIKD